jgi:hypothetical protein
MWSVVTGYQSENIWFLLLPSQPLNCTTSNQLCFVLLSVFNRCFTLLGRETTRVKHGWHHRRHPQVLPKSATDWLWGLHQEQRCLTDSWQWVSLAYPSILFPVVLWVVRVCATFTCLYFPCSAAHAFNHPPQVARVQRILHKRLIPMPKFSQWLTLQFVVILMSRKLLHAWCLRDQSRYLILSSGSCVFGNLIIWLVTNL